MAINFLTGERTERDRFENIRQQIKLRPTIFLGLGGIGAWAVALVRDSFAEVFKPLQKEGALSPIPECIRFLCFDSAVEDRPPQLTAGIQWHHLKADMPSEDFRRLLDEPFYRGWMPDVGTHEFKAGCGGKRGLGRVLFSRNMQLFDREFTENMNQARAVVRVENPTPQVFLLGSVSGGTGAGCLLDACFYIRHRYPEAEILALLALLPGGSTDEARNRNARIGAYAALKELNVFLGNDRPDKRHGMGVEYSFPAAEQIRGRLDRPLDFCFLLTEKDSTGTMRLRTEKHVTAFMARCAFFLTAHCVHTEGAQKSFASAMNDVQERAFDSRRGALTAFQVPALGQIHLPIEAAADYFACKYAADFLVYMKGGEGFPDEDSKGLAAALGLSLGHLASAVARTESGDPILARDYTAEKELLRDGKRRYENACRDQILDCGNAMPDARLKTLRELMAPRTAALVQDALAGLREAVARCLKDPRYRIVGAKNMLEDIRGCIDAELGEYRRREADEFAPSRRGISETWANIKPLIEDVTKRGGLLDLDVFKVGRAVDNFGGFIDDAEQTILSEARVAQAAEVLKAVKVALENELGRLRGLEACLDGAHAHIIGARKQLETALLRDEQGQGIDPLTICSFSPLTEEWRRDYGAAKFGNMTGDFMLTNLTRGTWGPIDWLALSAGAKPAARLAQDIYNRVDTEFIRDLRAANLESVAEVGGRSLSDMLSEVRRRLTRPMCGYSSMSGRLDATVNSKWFRSVDSSRFKNPLPQEADTTDALSFEENHATYMGVFYPIALAGCDPVLDKFEREYTRFRVEIAEQARGKAQKTAAIIESELLKFHCFIGSQDWPEPTEYQRATDNDVKLFAQGFAISILLDPDRLPAEVLSAGQGEGKPTALADALRKALGFVDKKAKAPKEKRFGLFRIGRSNYWLTPRFDFAQENDAREPIKMGGRITEAIEKIKQDPEAVSILKDWATWFESEWPQFYRGPELKVVYEQAYKEAGNLLAQQTDGSPDRKLWKDVMTAMKEWESSLI